MEIVLQRFDDGSYYLGCSKLNAHSGGNTLEEAFEQLIYHMQHYKKYYLEIEKEGKDDYIKHYVKEYKKVPIDGEEEDE